MESERHVKRLTELSEKKLELLHEMFLLSKQQTEAINNEAIDSLQEIIDGRQSLIDRIDRMDEEFNVYYQRLKYENKINGLDELDKLASVEGIATLKKLVAEIMQKLEDISVVDAENKRRAEQLLQGFTVEMQKLSQGKRINSAYKPVATQDQSVYFDRKK